MRIAYIISQVDQMESLERTLLELSSLTEHLFVIQLNPVSDKMSLFLIQQSIKTIVINAKGVSSWPSVIIRIRKVLLSESINAVHAHFFLAGLIGITAAFLAKVQLRIYTRHHGSEHHLYHPKGVLMDKFTNSISTAIIAISPVVQRILVQKEGVDNSKIYLIPHGLDFNTYKEYSKSRANLLREKYCIRNSDYPIIGVIARYDQSKGHQYIIQAFSIILETYPHAKLILANARGPYKQQIKFLLRDIPKDNYLEIEYEYDVISLYKTFDVFVHVPTSIDYESFGLVYLESLALSVPSVFTISGIASEFLEHEVNALIVPYHDATAIAIAIQRLITDSDLVVRLKVQGHTDVLQRFAFNNYFTLLLELYKSKVSR